MSASKRMPPPRVIDVKTRNRIAAWIRYKMKELGKNQREMSAMLGINEATLSRALADGPIGLDLVIAMHRKLGISANALLDADPRPGD